MKPFKNKHRDIFLDDFHESFYKAKTLEHKVGLIHFLFDEEYYEEAFDLTNLLAGQKTTLSIISVEAIKYKPKHLFNRILTFIKTIIK